MGFSSPVTTTDPRPPQDPPPTIVGGLQAGSTGAGAPPPATAEKNLMGVFFASASVGALQALLSELQADSAQQTGTLIAAQIGAGVGAADAAGASYSAKADLDGQMATQYIIAACSSAMQGVSSLLTIGLSIRAGSGEASDKANINAVDSEAEAYEGRLATGLSEEEAAMPSNVPGSPEEVLSYRGGPLHGSAEEVEALRNEHIPAARDLAQDKARSRRQWARTMFEPNSGALATLTSTAQNLGTGFVQFAKARITSDQGTADADKALLSGVQNLLSSAVQDQEAQSSTLEEERSRLMESIASANQNQSR